jgi:hypothetical protein
MDWQATISGWLDEDWVRYLLLPGLAALGLALAGWRGERRRKARRDPDAVSWIPWLGLTFWSSFAAMLLLGMALKAWLAG